MVTGLCLKGWFLFIKVEKKNHSQFSDKMNKSEVTTSDNEVLIN